jgi:hypothetical protein
MSASHNTSLNIALQKVLMFTVIVILQAWLLTNLNLARCAATAQQQGVRCQPSLSASHSTPLNTTVLETQQICCTTYQSW